jgi:hypothetical protein
MDFARRDCWWYDLWGGVCISDDGRLRELGYVNTRRQVHDETAPDGWLYMRRDPL